MRQYRFGWQESIFEIGVSIGLVPITVDSGDMAQVLSAADAACYVAKESGRNRMHEYQPDDSALAERYGEMQWIYRIHKAFAEHRFCLYQQSIHPLHGDGSEPPLCEIFIRMLDEDGRLATPAAFIPAAERYHLIASIDRWVVHAAFMALACGTLSHGDTTCFAINLSGQSLGDEAFLDYVLAEIEATGIAPERIFFEITETAAVGNLAQAMHFIRVLKELGCRFVLDDFGSGLSSFAYLKNLPGGLPQDRRRLRARHGRQLGAAGAGRVDPPDRPGHGHPHHRRVGRGPRHPGSPAARSASTTPRDMGCRCQSL